MAAVRGKPGQVRRLQAVLWLAAVLPWQPGFAQQGKPKIPPELPPQASDKAKEAVAAQTAPTVSLTAPAAGALYTAPATILLDATANASNKGKSIARVEFYNGTSLIGAVTAPPYSINWLQVPQGSYSLSARVTDNLGTTATSTAVTVTVNTALAQIYYIHTDHLNTPRAIFDQQQRLVWRWDQTDPFGGNPPNENPSGLGNFTFNLRLPGQYFDKETGLAQNWHRDYSSEIGRYIQSDPIGLRGGINTYPYVRSNPLNRTDPSGLWSPEAHDFLLKNAFPSLTGAQLAQVMAGSRDADAMALHGPDYTYIHAMSSPKLSRDKAQELMCAFVRGYMGAYNAMRTSSDPVTQHNAYYWLGFAMHPVMDSTSPAHSGFQYWPGLGQAMIQGIARKHGDGTQSVEDLAAAERNPQPTIDLMRAVLRGDLSQCGCSQ